VSGIETLRELVGVDVGPSSWRTVTQEDITAFARISGDDLWIHTDPERAARESATGTTIAHGNMTLSFTDAFRFELYDYSFAHTTLNLGWDRVRFPAPVPVNSRVRARSVTITAVDDLGEGWYRIITRFEIEREGEEKPVCVADSVARVLVTEP